ncbi:MAG: hypothetical protein Fur002_05430 [Anaerolineales bacterium]
MNLLVLSHKELWRDSSSPSGYSTVGGFPFQMKALAELFDETVIMATEHSTPTPSGAIPLTGNHLRVEALPAPAGKDARRKLDLLFWLPRNLPRMWKAARAADVIHTPVGGDVGTIGIFIALAQRKRLFVRHCGTWGTPASTADAWLQKFLELIASPQCAVFATGGAATPPSRKNPNIQWIFSTSLTQAELDSLPKARARNLNEPLQLIFSGRLAPAKNVQNILEALPLIHEKIPAAQIHLLGAGESRPALEARASALHIADAVHFHGNVSHEEVMKALAQSHCFVFPSAREGFPKSVLEALACGLPVVASNTSVIPQLLSNGCGVVLPDVSPQAIAQAVLNLAAQPQDAWRRMSALAMESARRYALEAWGAAIGARLRAAWGELKK